MTINSVTSSLKPYPMEELAIIRARLVSDGKSVFDFGTGDPKIPLWSKINESLVAALPTISQYPSIKGDKELADAHAFYLRKRFNIELNDDLQVLPTRGSKEAVFHIALSLVGRLGRKKIIYPDPGYPVYESSTLFANGTPYPVQLNEEDGYLLCPWNLPDDVQNDCAAIWVNYPHNPTGAIANDAYWKQLVEWAEAKDVVILSDDCYVDIFNCSLEDKPELQPKVPLQFSRKNVLCFFSLSKRSGFTGYRCGMMAGDAKLLGPITKARANMGLGQPAFIQAAAATAWRDEQHVRDRRAIFDQRMKVAVEALREIGWLTHTPQATFYIWSDITNTGKSDIDVAKDLAELGVIATPGQWLGHNRNDRLRFALVPDLKETKEAFNIVKEYLKGL